MKGLRNLVAASLLFAAQAAPTPCGRIGLLLPPDEPQAAHLRSAAKLAAQFPHPDGIPPADLVVRGRRGQWGDDGTEAGRLALDDQVMGLITPPDGSATHLVLQIAGRTALPVISLCPDTSVTGSGIPWLAQVLPDTVQQAGCLMSRLHPAAAIHTTWPAIVPSGRAGREVINDLRQATRRHSNLSVEPREHPTDAHQQSDLARQLAAQDAPVVLVWLDPESAGTWTDRLRQHGFRGILAGPAWLQSRLFLDTAGQAAEGFRLPTPLLSSGQSSEVSSFASFFKKHTGTPTDAPAAYTHDAILLLRHLAWRTSPDKGAQRPTSFANLPPLNGLTGPLAFEPSGKRILRLTVAVRQNHHWLDLP